MIPLTDTGFEQTLADSVSLSGVGVHTGAPVTLTMSPAAERSGIRFFRNDLAAPEPISAHARQVTELQLGTTLCNAVGQSVATVEHFLAACYGVGVDNLTVTMDGPEVPIMDGSSKLFVDAMMAVGLVAQSARKRRIRIVSDIHVSDGDKWAKLTPSDDPWLTLNADIDFASRAIGRQKAAVTLAPGAFADEIGFARTFGFAHEVEALQKMGLARGGSLENAIVIEEDRILNDEGLRIEDEFVRHKILDAVGDLMLAGAPIAGRYEAHLPGHALNNRLVLKLLDSPDAWCWEESAATGSA